MLPLKHRIEHAQTLFDMNKISAIPKEILKLNSLLSQLEMPETSEVVKLISQNMNLTAELIKTANYPVFSKNRATNVSSIRDAVDVIGLKSLKSLVMGIYYSMEYLGRARAEINQLSLNTAAMCSFLSPNVMNVNPDQAYLAGLFYNSGAILMATKFKDYDDAFMETLSSPFHNKLIENKRYTVCRHVAGLLLVKKWQLGKFMGHVIYQSHKKQLSDIEDDQIRALVALIQLSEACIIQHEMADYYSEEVEMMRQNANKELMIEEQEISETIAFLFPQPSGG
ncbi:HDOD domain-containing protein [Hydrogenovibrio kuenenii]|uniref:HDOD domain-containing protein n=1 Tax=Hydrogenovibrio kuenenii TaxID=63658 RepID=UPI0004634D32|nr:HDOD domain-containing protein [Hydrogenovibrio kuenenii]